MYGEPLKPDEYIMMTFYKKNFDTKSYHYFDNFDESFLKREFEVDGIYKYFTESNKRLHCFYFRNKKTDKSYIIVSDNLENLKDDVNRVCLIND